MLIPYNEFFLFFLLHKCIFCDCIKTLGHWSEYMGKTGNGAKYNKRNRQKLKKTGYWVTLLAKVVIKQIKYVTFIALTYI